MSESNIQKPPFFMQSVLGVGTEIVECNKIRSLMERHAERFIHRAFTPNETIRCSNHARPVESFAAFWAGKCAVSRSLGLNWNSGQFMRDIELVGSPQSGLTVVLTGRTNEKARTLDVAKILLSVSANRLQAVGYAITIQIDSVGNVS